MSLDYSTRLKNCYEKISTITNVKCSDRMKNSIITAPTQVGKTKGILHLLRRCAGWLTVISCDNKVDQLKQLVSRIKTEHIRVFKIDTCRQNLGKIVTLLEKKQPFVIVLMNNNSQIKILNDFIAIIKNEIDQYICIHDEADIVSKSDMVVDVLEDPKMAKSHMVWLKHFDYVKEHFNRVSRVFVSATYENCCILYDIKAKDTYILPTPDDYKPVNLFTEWNGDNDDLFYDEINRIKITKSDEVILYSYDRYISKQHDKAMMVSDEKDCICIVYNSSGFEIFGIDIGDKKYYSVDLLLQKIKELNNTFKPVVIFGSELMKRGISFVGKGEKPLTATVMFLSGATSYTVSIVQKIGRITGTARSDLKDRRVFCSKQVFNDYCKYIKNQQIVFSVIDKYPNLSLVELLALVDCEKINRNVDRPAMKIVNKTYKECVDIKDDDKDSAIVILDNDEKMKKCIKTWWKSKSIIGKITRFVYEKKVCSETVLKEYIESLGAFSRTWITDLYQKTKKYSLVFIRNGDKSFSLNEKAINYIKTL